MESITIDKGHKFEINNRSKYSNGTSSLFVVISIFFQQRIGKLNQLKDNDMEKFSGFLVKIKSETNNTTHPTKENKGNL